MCVPLPVPSFLLACVTCNSSGTRLFCPHFSNLLGSFILLKIPPFICSTLFSVPSVSFLSYFYHSFYIFRRKSASRYRNLQQHHQQKYYPHCQGLFPQSTSFLPNNLGQVRPTSRTISSNPVIYWKTFKRRASLRTDLKHLAFCKKTRRYILGTSYCNALLEFETNRARSQSTHTVRAACQHRTYSAFYNISKRYWSFNFFLRSWLLHAINQDRLNYFITVFTSSTFLFT
jgi:hypothetical protein